MAVTMEGAGAWVAGAGEGVVTLYEEGVGPFAGLGTPA